MTKGQKAGLISSAVTFIIIGLIFIIVGFKYDDSVLKFMGYFWLPSGILHFLFLMILFRRKNTSNN